MFETVQDYIDALNANGTWVTYDETTNTAKITSITDFAEAVKTASKGIAAFDQLDSAGHTVDYRLNMYSPLYYLLSGSEGYQTSNVARYFRINTGLWQSDTAVNTEANLVLALQNYGSNVDYSFVWGQEHTMAERSGDSTSNFIAWVNECVAAEAK